MLTDEELDLIAKLGDCFMDFQKLHQFHPSDKGDFVFHVHALQNLVMIRSAVRAHPDLFDKSPKNTPNEAGS